MIKRIDTKKTEDSDSRHKREVAVQISQASFHFLMSVLVFMTCPPEYIQNPFGILYQRFNSDTFRNYPEPSSVVLVYIFSTVYNTVLYFWDPLSNRKIQFYHIISVLIIPMSLFYEKFYFAVITMLLTYFIDITDTLMEYRYAPQFDKRRVLLAMIKIHHIVTLLLIGLSWVMGFMSIGIYILFIHDVTDVSMFVLRILRKQNADIIRIALVDVVVISTWLYYRVFNFGTVLFDISCALLQEKETLDQPLLVCVAGLGLLWLMNVYWTGLLIVKSIRTLCLGENTDKDDE